MKSFTLACLWALMIVSAAAFADEPARPGVAAIQASHDQALIRDLTEYVQKNPKADDADQAYLVIFDKAIEHDWFEAHEAQAKRYLADFPDGAVRSLAHIVVTMGRAQAGDFAQALAQFKELMGGLGQVEQEEFAANFAETLADTATTAGESGVARQVYEILLSRYGESPALRQKVRANLARLDKIGKPAPAVAVADVQGKPIRLEDFRGKYVLVDFWATWCIPCMSELPRIQAAYNQFHDAGFDVIGVSLDETKAAVMDFVKARNLPWRQIHNASSGGDLVEAFSVGAIPATFLLDPQGVITRLDLRGPALERCLSQLLKGGKPESTAARRGAELLRGGNSRTETVHEKE
jgi:peroxiredoxin/predicted negative regulator of RcsB-dependent stress response